MAYEVLARKWRPQQFAEVVGQEHITRTLGNALRTGRLAHAYLFVGPRGIGKTSIARIMAKALNCQQGPTDQPCDRCPSCLEIVAGASLDVQEIDGASNRGIDDIRALRETVRYQPAGRFKIIIIDEVHQVTNEGFNALLKTLEEPPPRVKFIFATTEPQKIPATIISRCQRFDLRRIPVPLLIERLRLIAGREGLDCEDDALLAIARAAEGSLRDAESALDQLAAGPGQRISEADVLAVFGLISRQALGDLVDAVLRGDMAAIIRLVGEWDRQGKDFQRLLLETLEHVRNLLILIQADEQAIAADLTAPQLELLKKQAQLTGPDRLLRIVEILTDNWDRLRHALSKKTLLETALIRCARAAQTVALDEILARIRALQAGEPPPAAPARAAPAAAAPPAQPATPPPAAAVPAPAPETPPADELTRLQKDWPAILEQIGRSTPLARSALLDATPVAVRGAEVLIAFDPEFADRVEQAGASRNRLALEKVLSAVLRRKVTAAFIAGQPAAAPPAAAAPAGKSTAKSRHRLVSQEAVQKTLDMFNGRILDIKE